MLKINTRPAYEQGDFCATVVKAGIFLITPAYSHLKDGKLFKLVPLGAETIDVTDLMIGQDH